MQYSLVLRVRYKVDSTRAGQETNYINWQSLLKLTAQSHREAFEEAAVDLSINTQLYWQYDGGNWHQHLVQRRRRRVRASNANRRAKLKRPHGERANNKFVSTIRVI